MFDRILRNATLPGAFVNAIKVSKDSDLEEKRRTGGYEMDDIPKPDRPSAPRGARIRALSIFTRGASKSDA